MTRMAELFLGDNFGGSRVRTFVDLVVLRVSRRAGGFPVPCGGKLGEDKHKDQVCRLSLDYRVSPEL